MIPWSLYTLKIRDNLGITAVSELSVHLEVSDSFSFSLDYCDAFLTHDSTTVRKQHNMQDLNTNLMFEVSTLSLL